MTKKQKISDKLAPKGQAHRRAQQETSEFTPAQRLMRDEMSRDLHKDGPHPAVSFSVALDEVVGMPASTGDVADMAVDIIGEVGTGLHTGLKEWAIIQRMIEAGIRVGYKLGSQDTAADLMGG